MERYNRGAGAASAPTPPSAPANPYFTEGNPSLGVPATQPGPWWFHMITEEMRKVITDAGLTPDHTNLTQLSAAIQAMIASAQINVPAGHVDFFAMNTAPAGYLKANGAQVSRTTYADLFAAIGTTFGAGDGSTTFTLPDLRAEFLRAWDDGRGVDSGRVFGSAQLDAMQGHFHSNPAGHVLLKTSPGTSSTGSYLGSNSSSATVQNPITDGVNGTPRVAAETRPRNIALLACIKY